MLRNLLHWEVEVYKEGLIVTSPFSRSKIVQMVPQTKVVVPVEEQEVGFRRTNPGFFILQLKPNSYLSNDYSFVWCRLRIN